MSFQNISEEVRLPADEVEHLVMKALRYGSSLPGGPPFLTRKFSLKLIRGNVDQVDQRVLVDWVQPRVLSRTQIGALAGRLTEWIDRLGKLDGMYSDDKFQK